MSNDPITEGHDASPTPVPESGANGSRYWFIPENWLNIFTSIAEPATIPDNDFIIRLANLLKMGRRAMYTTACPDRVECPIFSEIASGGVLSSGICVVERKV